jgi:hypothetical protein
MSLGAVRYQGGLFRGCGLDRGADGAPEARAQAGAAAGGGGAAPVDGQYWLEDVFFESGSGRRMRGSNPSGRQLDHVDIVILA